ncbi:MAG: threonine synthase [Candidatus Neomarinimicrobiota bacterium]|nr:MAG: threonine synthase [Candidatus Neomarinimicrobiota bacterium]
MRFYNVRDRKEVCNFKEAVLKNVGRCGGLFVPYEMPFFSRDFFKSLAGLKFPDMSYEIARHFFDKDDIPDSELEKIVRRAFNFRIEFKELRENVFVLELFHGPTLSFKDFAARFMAGYMSYLAQEIDRELTVLVATSGDTGSAIANAYYGVENVRVYVLYPSGRVSELQEKQIATLGGNITALEVEGTFDDCQSLVKKAFVDPSLSRKLSLTSANSINVARLIPQAFYYFYSSLSLSGLGYDRINISVPCGNFGNLTAGVLAKKMGAPVSKFIAATNANDTFTRYLRTGVFKPKETVKTLANAMDVGNPNNFPRLLELYEGAVEKMKVDIDSFSFCDDEIRSAIQRVYEKYGYVMDPHGACGFMGLEKYWNTSSYRTGEGSVFLETAHPGKFREEIAKLLGVEIELPSELKRIASLNSSSHKISSDYSEFRDFLMSKV